MTTQLAQSGARKPSKHGTSKATSTYTSKRISQLQQHLGHRNVSVAPDFQAKRNLGLQSGGRSISPEISAQVQPCVSKHDSNIWSSKSVDLRRSCRAWPETNSIKSHQNIISKWLAFSASNKSEKPTTSNFLQHPGLSFSLAWP